MGKIKVSSLIMGEIPYKSWVFPGGELGVKLEKFPNNGDSVLVEATGILFPDDIFELLQICNAFNSNIDIIVKMPYVPYARQDRVCNPGEAFSLKIFVNMLKELPISRLIVTDPHSDVFRKHFVDYSDSSIELIVEPQILFTHPLHHKYDIVLFPDEGAQRKYIDESFSTGLKYSNCYYMNKQRTPEGVVYSDISKSDKEFFESKKVLVVDDICDGGRTFISLAQALNKCAQPKQLDLYVTHGIFSSGVSTLFSYYNDIYCHNIMTESQEVLQSVRKV